MPDESEYLTVQQAAAHFNVHDATIRRWINNGRLRAIRVGPQLIRIPLSAITDLQQEATDG